MYTNDMKVDLHMHTTDSDGSIKVEDLLEAILASDLQVFAVTEHENMNNIEKITAFAKENNLIVIPSVELTVNHYGKRHILGYGVDHSNEKLVKMMDSNSYIVDSGLDTDASVFPKPREVIDAIIEAGGIPVVAHPGNKKYGDFKKYLDEMINFGIKGIECFHPENNEEVTRYALALCKENDLCITGGSDYHGDCHPDRELGMMNLRIKDISLKRLFKEGSL